MECKVKLNLPNFNIKTRTYQGKNEIWDYIRMRWLILTPEEWVRQNFIRFIVEYKNAPRLMIKQELKLILNGTKKRADIIVYGTDGKPRIIVECKAPFIKISNETIEQITRYNIILKTPYLIVTNGITHYCFKYDCNTNTTEIIDDIPTY